MAQTQKSSALANKAKKIAAVKFKNIDEYVATIEAGTKNIFKELRRTIRQAVPGGEEVISYNMPAIKLNGKIVIWFAAWQEHISLYPGSVAMRDAIRELPQYLGSKGTIKFPLDKPIPIGLVTKIVKFRLKEVS